MSLLPRLTNPAPRVCTHAASHPRGECAVCDQVGAPRWVGRFSPRRSADAPQCGAFGVMHPAHRGVTSGRRRNAFVHSLLSLSLLLLPLPSFAKFEQTAPQASVPAARLERAQRQSFITTMQASFPAYMMDRERSVIARVWEEIPQHFPEFKNNTLGRMLHSTLLYLDGATYDELIEIIRFMESVPAETLRAYNLLGRFKYFDPNDFEIFVVGRRTRFAALRPHQEFRDWQSRFWRLLADLNPALLARHTSHRGLGDRAIGEYAAHMSLTQFRKNGAVYAPGEEPQGYGGPELTRSEGRAVAARMRALFESQIAQMRAEGLEPESLYFDSSQTSLEIVNPPRSLNQPPVPVVTFAQGSDGRYHASKVAVLMVDAPAATASAEAVDNDDDIEGTGTFKEFLEINTAAALAGDRSPIESRSWYNPAWLDNSRVYPPLPDDQMIARLSQRLAQAYTRALRTLSPTKKPALVASRDGHEFFVTSYTHSKLHPEKAIPILEKLRPYLPASSDDVSIGSSLYASSGREDIKNPSDYDLAINSLIYVPSHIRTLEAAERFVARRWVRDVLGHFIEQARQGRMHFIEMRMGSAYTQATYLRVADGIKSGAISEDQIVGLMENNNFMSNDSIINNDWRDPTTGRLWRQDELALLRDFIKGKVDLYLNGQRQEVSLQFFVGFEWQNNTYYLQRNGLKGCPPLMRTAVNDGARSVAIAATLSRPADFVTIRRGPSIARAIGDLIRTVYPKNHFEVNAPVTAENPLWSAKALKRTYNFMIFLRNSGLGLDEIFFEETRRILVREGRMAADEGIDVPGLINAMLGAINQKAIHTVNLLKRNVGDYHEFNELDHHFQPTQWQHRQQENGQIIAAVDELIRDNVIHPSEDFMTAFNEFRATYLRAESFAEPQRAARFMRSMRRLPVLENMKTQLNLLEHHLNAEVDSPVALSEANQRFLQTFVSYAPHFYHRYVFNRSQDRGNTMRWALRFMKVALGPNPEAKMALMEHVSVNLDTMTRADVAAFQRLIFSPPASPITPNTTCKAALEPSPTPRSAPDESDSR